MKSGPGSPNYIRLRDQGTLKRCNKCGEVLRTNFPSYLCKHWVKDCGGDLIEDDVRNAIDLAKEKLEITKLKLKKAEKRLKDMESPSFQFPEGRMESLIEGATRKRDKLRKQLTAMGFDWAQLEETDEIQD